MAPSSHRPPFSEPHTTPESFVFPKLLQHIWTQLFRVQSPSCSEAFQKIKNSGTLCIFREAFKISLVGASGHCRMKISLCELQGGGEVSSDSVGVSSRGRIAGSGFPEGTP